MEAEKNAHQIEIMSPVKSFEGIEKAIEAGAGSVYFGAGDLNCRALDKVNFTEDDLPRIAETCRKHGVKSYLTLNVIIYDDELDEMMRLVDKAKESQITAIIACDHSVLLYCKKVGMTAHISTMANISNIGEVEYYSDFADTIVLGRELDLDQIGNIAKKIKERNIKGPSGNLVRVEVFVHGYFCIAISGKCHISLHSTNYSVNRGACKMICNRQYIAKDVKGGTDLLIDNQYVLSAKSLCTIEFVDKIIEAGVSIFKIEGRSKDANYTYVTTKCYREAVDAYFDGTFTQDKINRWKIELATVGNSGFWSGYYLGRKIEGEEWSGSPNAKIIKNKSMVAKGLHYVPEERRGWFKLEGQKLQEGDAILIDDPVAGVIQKPVEGIEVDGQKVKTVKRGETFSLFVPKETSKAAKVFKIEYEKPRYVLSFCSRVFKGLFGEKAHQYVRQLINK